MSSSPPWLAKLLRVREYRRDAARQSLAQSLQTASRIRDAATDVEAKLSHLGQSQQQRSHVGRVDSERLRQLRQERDDLRSHLNNLNSQQTFADAAVQKAQATATATNSEAEVLKRLHDRLDSIDRQAQRRREEQTPLESAVSLCNGPLSG